MSEQSHLKSADNHMAAYKDLKYYFSNLYTLFSIRGTLAVDMMTSMPQGGLHRRMADISAITKRIYAETTSNAVSKLIDEVEATANANKDEWSKWDLANVFEMRRIHSHLSALPPELYIASVQVANEGRKRHAAAQSQTWDDILPYLSQIIDLYRKIAALKQKKFETKTPYKSLLLGYASDISEPEMDKLYDDLLEPLAKIRDEAIAKQNEQPRPLALEGNFSRTDQMWLNKTILEIMGFDFNRGNLQVTGLSPMVGGNSDDTRVLVRCGDSNNFLDSMEDTLYQGACGIYTQNLPSEWVSQPVGQDLGTVMMTANSILYETMIGRTPQFFEFIAVRAEGVFRQFKNKSFEPENLYRLKKMITPTAHRNNADELTKIFHDVMRYRIERDLINGVLDIKDLPSRWNDESKKYLGITPTTQMEGPLQNPDWFTGRFGFISTNTLSHIIAATLQEKLFSIIPDLSNMVHHGDFKPMGEWLKTNIYSKGRSVECLSLIEDITGEKLSTGPLLRHFERRYLSDKR